MDTVEHGKFHTSATHDAGSVSSAPQYAEPTQEAMTNPPYDTPAAEPELPVSHKIFRINNLVIHDDQCK